jgi:energy-converting hydrogenase Eha subunit G
VVAPVEVARFAGTLTALAVAAVALAVIRAQEVLALLLAGLHFLATGRTVPGVLVAVAGLQAVAEGLVFWDKAQVEQQGLEQLTQSPMELRVAAVAASFMVPVAVAAGLLVVMAQSESSGRARPAHSHQPTQGTCK